jgi:hypothetical protein
VVGFLAAATAALQAPWTAVPLFEADVSKPFKVARLFDTVVSEVWIWLSTESAEVKPDDRPAVMLEHAALCRTARASTWLSRRRGAASVFKTDVASTARRMAENRVILGLVEVVQKESGSTRTSWRRKRQVYEPKTRR